MNNVRNRAGIAGLVGAGLSIGLGELLAGLFRSVPSPLAAVGGVVVDSSPSFLKDFAISVFGTADKTALAIGTTVIVLILGWLAGTQTLQRRWVGAAVIGVFALLGALAGLGEPFAEPIMVVAATAVAATLGWLTLDRLVAAAARVPEPTDGLAEDPARRRFVWLVAGGSAAAVVGGIGGRRLLARLPDVPEIEGASSLGGLAALGADQDFEIAGLSPIVVPNDEFYRIDTALVVPLVDERDWTLRVHGMVDREVEITYDELLAMDSIEEYVTIACVSNQVGGDLVGNALWTGVPLTEVLDAAGVPAEATQIVGRSIDGFTAGFPTELALDGRQPIIAYGMNGEPLPRGHGFPARLIVPGLYGYVSATKWLTEIELTTWEDFNGYWVPRGWAKEGPIKTQSRIDVPTGRQTLPAGPTVVAGVAWAPVRGISAVDVKVDSGGWRRAEVSAPLSDKAWVQWKTTVDLPAGDHVLSVRAIDGSGMVQTDKMSRPRPDGATGHHSVEVQVA